MAALDALLSDPAGRGRMALAGRERAEEHFTYDRLAGASGRRARRVGGWPRWLRRTRRSAAASSTWFVGTGALVAHEHRGGRRP